ncbi:MAG: hypothetical protein JNM39_18440 [Bdellovibrionaceae bacterium]|nr:hypothetical protein [Pseudobdellovibrionaceae bacterium]
MKLKNRVLSLSVLVILVIFSSIFSQTVFSSQSESSSFNEVWNVVMDRDFSPSTKVETTEFSVYAKGLLPIYPVNYSSVFGDGDEPLTRDAVRTTTERFDFYDRLPKRLHPNGVCVSGIWKVSEQTPYTGLLGSQATGLFIGRISVAMGHTEAPEKRGFGFAGKVFRTLDKAEPILSANFFTVDVLLGTRLPQVLDAAMTNEPETGFDFSLIGLGLKIGTILSMADSNPGFRPLTQLAQAGIPMTESPIQPRWIRLRAEKPLKMNKEHDFRREILVALQANKTLTYLIEVSDVTSNRKSQSGWTRIGAIELDQAEVSYGCDRRLHFSHPKLK